MVVGALWKPSYDVRVFSDDQSLILTYYGEITQQTLEDWTNVRAPCFLRRLVSPFHSIGFIVVVDGRSVGQWPATGPRAVEALRLSTAGEQYTRLCLVVIIFRLRGDGRYCFNQLSLLY